MLAFRIHHTLTEARVVAACERRLTSTDDPGFCTACGAGLDGIEPDARGYECECCGAEAVYGADELLLELAAGSARRAATTARPSSEATP